MLYEIADILQIDVQLLLGKDPERRTDALNCIDQVEVQEIRAALERYDSMSAYFDARARARRRWTDMRKAVNHAWLTYQYGRYGMLTRALPKLLRDAQAADAGVRRRPGRRRPPTCSRRSTRSPPRCCASSASATWPGSPPTGRWRSPSGPTTRCWPASPPTGSATPWSPWAAARPALELNVNIANRLAPGGANEATPQRLSVYGMLLLQGAMAAARIGDAATVRDLIDGAEEAADLLGADQNHYWTSLRPDQPGAAPGRRRRGAGRGGPGGRDPPADHGQPGFDALLPERRAHHLLDTARGYAQIGDLANAGEMLLQGDRLAPSEIRCRPIAHELMSDVLRRTRGAPPAPIAEFAAHMGVGI